MWNSFRPRIQAHEHHEQEESYQALPPNHPPANVDLEWTATTIKGHLMSANNEKLLPRKTVERLLTPIMTDYDDSKIIRRLLTSLVYFAFEHLCPSTSSRPSPAQPTVVVEGNREQPERIVVTIPYPGNIRDTPVRVPLVFNNEGTTCTSNNGRSDLYLILCKSPVDVAKPMTPCTARSTTSRPVSVFTCLTSRDQDSDSCEYNSIHSPLTSARLIEPCDNRSMKMTDSTCPMSPRSTAGEAATGLFNLPEASYSEKNVRCLSTASFHSIESGSTQYSDYSSSYYYEPVETQSDKCRSWLHEIDHLRATPGTFVSVDTPVSVVESETKNREQMPSVCGCSCDCHACDQTQKNLAELDSSRLSSSGGPQQFYRGVPDPKGQLSNQTSRATGTQFYCTAPNSESCCLTLPPSSICQSCVSQEPACCDNSVDCGIGERRSESNTLPFTNLFARPTVESGFHRSRSSSVPPKLLLNVNPRVPVILPFDRQHCTLTEKSPTELCSLHLAAGEHETESSCQSLVTTPCCPMGSCCQQSPSGACLPQTATSCHPLTDSFQQQTIQTSPYHPKADSCQQQTTPCRQQTTSPRQPQTVSSQQQTTLCRQQTTSPRRPQTVSCHQQTISCCLVPTTYRPQSPPGEPAVDQNFTQALSSCHMLPQTSDEFLEPPNCNHGTSLPCVNESPDSPELPCLCISPTTSPVHTGIPYFNSDFLKSPCSSEESPVPNMEPPLVIITGPDKEECMVMVCKRCRQELGNLSARISSRHKRDKVDRGTCFSPKSFSGSPRQCGGGGTPRTIHQTVSTSSELFLTGQPSQPILCRIVENLTSPKGEGLEAGGGHKRSLLLQVLPQEIHQQITHNVGRTQPPPVLLKIIADNPKNPVQCSDSCIQCDGDVFHDPMVIGSECQLPRNVEEFFYVKSVDSTTTCNCYCQTSPRSSVVPIHLIGHSTPGEEPLSCQNPCGYEAQALLSSPQSIHLAPPLAHSSPCHVSITLQSPSSREAKCLPNDLPFESNPRCDLPLHDHQGIAKLEEFPREPRIRRTVQAFREPRVPPCKAVPPIAVPVPTLSPCVCCSRGTSPIKFDIPVQLSVPILAQMVDQAVQKSLSIPCSPTSISLPRMSPRSDSLSSSDRSDHPHLVTEIGKGGMWDLCVKNSSNSSKNARPHEQEDRCNKSTRKSFSPLELMKACKEAVMSALASVNIANNGQKMAPLLHSVACNTQPDPSGYSLNVIYPFCDLEQCPCSPKFKVLPRSSSSEYVTVSENGTDNATSAQPKDDFVELLMKLYSELDPANVQPKVYECLEDGSARSNSSSTDSDLLDCVAKHRKGKKLDKLRGNESVKKTLRVKRCNEPNNFDLGFLAFQSDNSNVCHCGRPKSKKKRCRSSVTCRRTSTPISSHCPRPKQISAKMSASWGGLNTLLDSLAPVVQRCDAGSSKTVPPTLRPRPRYCYTGVSCSNERNSNSNVNDVDEEDSECHCHCHCSNSEADTGYSSVFPVLTSSSGEKPAKETIVRKKKQQSAEIRHQKIKKSKKKLIHRCLLDSSSSTSQ